MNLSLFDEEPAPPPIPFEWTEEQHHALDAIAKWRKEGSPFFSLTGPAGTGKTTLMREIVRRFPDACLTAMTGKAAMRLRQLSGRNTTTLHSVLYYPPASGETVRFTRTRSPEFNFVVVDESSMVTPQVFQDLNDWAELGVAVLFVGDPYQLPPVVTGEEARLHGEDYSVFSQVPGAKLERVMRNVGGVLRAATKIRESGKLLCESDVDSDGKGYIFEYSDSPMRAAVEHYLRNRDEHMLITWKNANRMAANLFIRNTLGHDGPLPDDGEPVLIKRNGWGFLNGEVVTCAGFTDGPRLGSLNTLWMKVAETGQQILISFEGKEEPFDGQMPWIQDWKRYHIDLHNKALPEPIPVTWGYCLTAHAGQGSEQKEVTVFLCPGDDRNMYFNKTTTLPNGNHTPFATRFVYTALTRGKEVARMLVGR